MESGALALALVVLALVEFLYYGSPLVKILTDYFLERNRQKDEYKIKMKQLEYDQSIPKEKANQHEMDMEQMRLKHEYEMGKLAQGVIEQSDSTIPPNPSASGIIPPTNTQNEETKYLN
ncbi:MULTISPECIES: hypothetical protein [Blautia]|uniref:Uncharacterized protein n=1 Tax=Blautia hominis TaxID=2025493 RepID=A0ABQ0B8W8_9FIRM|nr:hypothetical protein [Blautia marasmi]